jgi:pyrroline-5-carboxylate reductase
MPNAAAEIGRSYTPWFATGGVAPAEKAFVQAMFETCGEANQVFRESDIDLLTALTGAGPAWPALLAQAMLTYAEAKGLPSGIAERAAKAIVAGAGQLVATGEDSPRDIVQTFLDYRGTTAAGLQAMIGNGFIEAVHAGLDAAAVTAARMSAEMGTVNRDH